MKWIWSECRRRQEVCLLAAGAVDKEVKLELEQHLAACQECRGYYGEIKGLAKALAAWEQDLSAIKVTPAAQMRWAKVVVEAELQPMSGLKGRQEGQANVCQGNTRTNSSSHSSDKHSPDFVFSENTFWRVLWRELIRPNRYAWMGMAALWLAMFVVNGHLAGHQPHGMEAGAASSQEMIQDWEEQNRVLAELAQPALVVPAPPPRLPGPRSQRTGEWVLL